VPIACPVLFLLSLFQVFINDLLIVINIQVTNLRKQARVFFMTNGKFFNTPFKKV
jgi:hypothetical protein